MEDVTNDRLSRGERVKQIQKALRLDGKRFVELLQRITEDVGLDINWHEKRLSTLRTGTQDLSPEDIAVLEIADPVRRSWHWIAFGVSSLQGSAAAKRPASTSRFAKLKPRANPTTKPARKKASGEDGKGR